MKQQNQKFQWFENKNKLTFTNSEGIKLKLDTIKVNLLNEKDRFNINAKNKNFNIDALISVKDEKNKVCYFGVAGVYKQKLFVVRLNNKREYDDTIVYQKSDFLSLCTFINRKFKTY